MLPETVVRSVTRTHPEIVHEPGTAAGEGDAGCRGGQSRRGGRTAAVRRALTAYARRLGLPEQRTYDLVTAVHETVVTPSATAADTVSYGCTATATM